MHAVLTTHKRITLLSVLILCILALLSCNAEKNETPQHIEETPSFDLEQIKERGKLIALTDNSSSSYFIYKGKPMGYEFDLLTLYADHLGVDLEIVLVHDIDSIFHYLNDGKGDIVAANITVTKKRTEVVDFSNPILQARQVLVQRLPEKSWSMTREEVEKQLIRNQIDLAGKTVHVRGNSSFFARMESLSDEIGSPINIVAVPGDIETEQLIEQVAKGEIDYTIADENIALLNKAYYPGIDVVTPVSFPQKIAWAIKKGSPNFLTNLNDWIDKNRKTASFANIYAKYFRSRHAQKRRVNSDFSSLSGGKISQYDDLIKTQSKTLGWDWRLIAALIYHESHFVPDAESWTGASGLMQVLPETAAEYGIDSLMNPSENIRAGIKYLAWLDDYWKEQISDSTERIPFVLASYNVGLGHLIDAQRLAVKYGKSREVWEGNVAHFLLMKSRPVYYNDEAARHGYCRGIEPFRYVNSILNTYDHYKKAIP